MRFERTTDYDLVREVLTDPRLYPHMGDDYAPPIEHFAVNRHPAIWYVLVEDGSLGMFCFFPENAICWQAHAALARGLHPRLTRQAGRELMEWLWRETPCQRVIASVPASNRAAVRYGLDPDGMNLLPYGVNVRSFQKHGQLVDQILMGRSRPKGV